MEDVKAVDKGSSMVMAMKRNEDVSERESIKKAKEEAP